MAIAGLFLMSFLAFQNCDNSLPGALVTKDQGSSTPTPVPLPTPGPDEIRYTLGGWTCDSVDLIGVAQGSLLIRSMMLDLSDSAVRRSTLFFSACVKAQSFQISYPNASSIELTHGPTECFSCSTQQCYPMGPPNPSIVHTYSMIQNSSSLILSRALTSVEVLDVTSVYKQAGCIAGQTETLIYVRQ